MARSEGDQVLAGVFHAVMEKKKEADIYFKLLRSGIGNEFSYTRRILFQKDSSYKSQFCTKAGANFKGL